MYRGHTVGVVLPAYNEEGFVGDVIASIPPFVDRIYAVDDCSTDDTWAEIRRYVDDPDRTAPEVVALRHDRNRGAGGAIKTGYCRALADGMDVTVTMDADGQMDPALLPPLLDPVVEGRADYAKGNRLSSASAAREMPRFRLVGNWLLTALTRVASGYWRTTDPQNGYTAISRDALRAVEVETLYEYYGYCNDLLARLNAAEMRVVDVAMPAAYGDEASGIRYTGYVPRVSVLLLRSLLWRLRRRYLAGGVYAPAVCLGLGIVAAAAGLVAGVFGVWTALTGGSPWWSFVAALAFTLVGSLLAAVGMVFDRRESRHLEVMVG